MNGDNSLSRLLRLFRLQNDVPSWRKHRRRRRLLGELERESTKCWIHVENVAIRQINRVRHHHPGVIQSRRMEVWTSLWKLYFGVFYHCGLSDAVNTSISSINCTESNEHSLTFKPATMAPSCICDWRKFGLMSHERWPSISDDVYNRLTAVVLYICTAQSLAEASEIFLAGGEIYSTVQCTQHASTHMPPYI